MAHNGRLENTLSPADNFFVEEYKALLELDKERNERFDRLLTLFLSLAGAPWVLYALVIKEGGTFSLSQMPRLIAGIFIFTGLLGFVVVIMCVQTKFNITMYMRAVNTIRGRLLEGVDPKPGEFRLPTTGTVPPYNERGSYNFHATVGMAVVNGTYVGLGIYRLTNYFFSWWLAAIIAATLSGGLYALGQYLYYVRQAQRREGSIKDNELDFRKKNNDAAPGSKIP